METTRGVSDDTSGKLKRTGKKKLLWIIEKMLAIFERLSSWSFNILWQSVFESEEENSVLLFWYLIDLNGDDGWDVFGFEEAIKKAASQQGHEGHFQLQVLTCCCLLSCSVFSTAILDCNCRELQSWLPCRKLNRSSGWVSLFGLSNWYFLRNDSKRKKKFFFQFIGKTDTFKNPAPKVG